MLHLRRGASPNGRDSGGRTPLMISAAAGRTDVCLLLLEEGADPLLQDLEGRTASQLAELEGHRDLAVRLSKPVASIDTQTAEDHGADIDLDDNAFGWEPEEEFIPAVSSHPSSELSNDIQNAISAYRPKEEHDEWSFASIALPSGRQSRALALSAGARSILAGALAEGSISVKRLRMAWPAATVQQFQLLCTVLREAGTQIRFDRNEAIWSSCGEAVASPSDAAAVESVIDHVGDELAQDLTISSERIASESERRLSLSLSFSRFSAINRVCRDAPGQSLLSSANARIRDQSRSSFFRSFNTRSTD
ncbi:hypothetical protein BST63_35410 [Bradyrhizobium canariense]|uniref:Ankyrin repeat protein n=1 Tax=Bradyrhizobium canariense TaxID=255045 RepID=A0ABX3WSG0_9BRAD|nr:hypothetical protein BST63_35410 [Bradyrhizobium canariense]